jgi:hypothetical protein
MLKEPQRFSGARVTVRARVQIGFEDFQLLPGDCDGRAIDSVWLEYGRGPKKQPTVWCCGDMVPRDRLALRQNADFHKFHRYLTAQSRAAGCHELECLLYKVTATITGRFDAAAPQPCPGDDGRRCCFGSGGFGHFGMACARVVIESVSEVAADPVDSKVYKTK